MKISRHSLEYIFVPVVADGAAAMSHELAIVAGEPIEADWIAATWDVAESAARILVRASASANAGGDVTLSPGRHQVYWRSTANPQYPARRAGSVTVT